MISHIPISKTVELTNGFKDANWLRLWMRDERVIFPEIPRYLDWLGEKRDWPVSRQLWWGHQIPIWSYACQDQADLDTRLAILEEDVDIQAGAAAYQVELTAELNEQSRVVGDEAVETFAVIHICINDEN